MTEMSQNQLISEITSRLEKITGVNYIYFLNEQEKIVNEKKISGASNYIDQVKDIINSEDLFKETGKAFYEKEFHTCTLLNESGLIIVSKLAEKEYQYMIVIAGENEPVDLINLLKICKESRKKFSSSLNSTI